MPVTFIKALPKFHGGRIPVCLLCLFLLVLSSSLSRTGTVSALAVVEDVDVNAGVAVDADVDVKEEVDCSSSDSTSTCANTKNNAVTEEANTEQDGGDSEKKKEVVITKTRGRRRKDDDDLESVSDFIEWILKDDIHSKLDGIAKQSFFKQSIFQILQNVTEYPRQFTFLIDPFLDEDSLSPSDPKKYTVINDPPYDKPGVGDDDNESKIIFEIDNVTPLQNVQHQKTQKTPRTKQWREEDSQMVFEIDRDRTERPHNNLSFRWIKRGPFNTMLFENSAISSLLNRMYVIEDKLVAQLEEELANTDNNKFLDTERQMISDFHAVYLEALELAWMHRYHQIVNTTSTTATTTTVDNTDTDTTDTSTSTTAIQQPPQQQDMVEEYYDPLTDDEETGLGNNYEQMTFMNCAAGWEGDRDGTEVWTTYTFHQTIEYTYGEKTKSTYMMMDEMLHSSNVFRAHYHDGMVHIPAQYVKNMKRVAYIGGGDNMPLYELLKYPEIELIVGMELDQGACRSAFKHVGTSPTFQDPRVQWWFGDASKTLNAIPPEYFGSFDLVIVDLLSFVAEGIRMVANLSIFDMAPVLMKNKGGVLVRQEDYYYRSQPTTTMTQRVIEFNWLDVPDLCEASFTVGSNSIDLMAADARYDHGVTTLARMKEELNTSSPYEGWGRYYDHTSTTSSPSPSPAAGSGDNDGDDADDVGGGYNAVKCKMIQDYAKTMDVSKIPQPLSGFLLVIEAENVSMPQPLLDDMKELESRITKILKQQSLQIKLYSYNEKVDRNHLFIIFEEGYLKVQVYPPARYVAFDLMMWDEKRHQSDLLKDALIRCVGGNPTESTSSFRVITGGMSGLDNSGSSSPSLFETANRIFCGGKDNDSTEDTATTAAEDEASRNTESLLVPDQSIIISEIAKGLLPTNSKTTSSSSSVFVIFCGNEDDEDDEDGCTHLGTSLSTDSMTFHAVHSCDSFEDMANCLSLVQAQIETIVAENNNKKVDGILLGRAATVDTGKIVHKLFNNTLNQEKFLERSYMVLSPVPTTTDDDDDDDDAERWRKILLDRFRTEMVISHPLHRADIELYNDTHKDAWCITSVGHNFFLDSLNTALTAIHQQTDLLSITKEVQTGAKPVEYEFASIDTQDTDFYEPDIAEQWFSQTPVADQTLIQFEMKRPNTLLSVNDTVLVASPENLVPGFYWVDIYHMTDYFKATITEVLKGDKYKVKMHTQVLSDGTVIDGRPHHRGAIDRELIRKFPAAEDPTNTIMAGDFVLFPLRHEKTQEPMIKYLSGVVTAVKEKTGMVSVHYPETSIEFESVEMRSDFPLASCINVFEQIPALDIAPLTVSIIEEAFEQALLEAVVEEEEDAFLEPSMVIGEGVVVYAQWAEGNAVLKWDGLDRVEVNLLLQEGDTAKIFKEFETVFVKHIDHLKVLVQDKFPRGYGNVVNTKADLKDFTPRWITRRKEEAAAAPEEEDDDDWVCSKDDDEFECDEEDK